MNIIIGMIFSLIKKNFICEYIKNIYVYASK